MKKRPSSAYRLLSSGLLSGLLLAASAAFADSAEFTYAYQASEPGELSSMSIDSLTVLTLADQREDSERRSLPFAMPANEIVSRALSQALAAEGAKLQEEGGSAQLGGTLIALDVDQEAGKTVAAIECELNLRVGGRTAWQTTLRFQSSVDGENQAQALSSVLDILIADLFMDDYFLMPLGAL